MTGILVPEGAGKLALPEDAQEEVLVRPANRYLPDEVRRRERGVALSATGVPLKEEIVWQNGMPFYVPGMAAKDREMRARNRISQARIDEALAMALQAAEEDRHRYLIRRRAALQRANFSFMQDNWDVVKDIVKWRMQKFHEARGEVYF